MTRSMLALLLVLLSWFGVSNARGADPHAWAIAEVSFSPSEVYADRTERVQVQVRTPKPVEGLSGTAAGGSLEPWTSCGPRCFKADLVLTPPPTPRFAMVLVWGPGVAGVGILPVASRTVLPIQTEPDADVLVEIAGRKYGPIYSGKSGELKVPVEVPAGVAMATVRVRDRAGHTTVKPVDLNIPPSTRLVVETLRHSLPADGSSESVLLVASATAEGKPFRGSLLAETTSGEIVESALVGPGLGIVRIRSGTRAGTVQVSVQVPGVGSRKIPLAFKPGPPASIRITTEPPVLLAEGKSTSTVRVDVVDSNYNAVPDEKPDVTVTGGDVVDTSFDGLVTAMVVRSRSIPVGDEEASVTITARRAELSAEASLMILSPTGFRIVLRPERDTMPADGRSLLPVEVEVMDGSGRLVSGPGLRLSAAGGAVPSEVDLENGMARFQFRPGTLAGQGWIEAVMGKSRTRAPVLLEPGPPERVLLSTDPAKGRIRADIRIQDRFGNPVTKTTPRLRLAAAGPKLLPSREPGRYTLDALLDPSLQSVQIEARCGDAFVSRKIWMDGDWLAGLRLGYIFNFVDLINDRINSFIGIPISVEGAWLIPATDRGLFLVADLSYFYFLSEVAHRVSASGGGEQVLEAEIHAVDVSLGLRYYFITQSDWLPFVEALAGGRVLFGKNINHPGQASVLTQSVYGLTWSLTVGGGIERRFGPGRVLLGVDYIESPTDMPSQFSNAYRFDANAGGIEVTTGYRVSF